MPVCRECGRLNAADVPLCEKCGAAMSANTPTKQKDAEGELLDQLQQLLHQGRKIDAIKVYREHSGAGLAQAKEFVESLAAGEQPRASNVDDAFERELLNLLRACEKIQAIKIYRDRTGVGLKEAKDAVESLAKRHGVPVSSGCGGAALVLLAAALVLGGSAIAFAL